MINTDTENVYWFCRTDLKIGGMFLDIENK